MNPLPPSSNPLRAAVLGYALLAPFLVLVLAFRGVHLVLALAPLFVSHLLLLYPTLMPNCQWWGPVWARFQTSAREVWLTLDDGPSPAHTVQILDLLERFDARATFFVIGEKAEKHPHLITEILARGHALANHTYTHPGLMFWCAGPRRLGREIDRCAATLRSTPERGAHFFRAPAGLKNMWVHPALARRGLGLIGWTVRGLDTVKRDPVRVAARIEKRLQPGAIILLHEGHRAQSNPAFNLRCLELTLERLTALDYRCIIPRPEQLRP